MMNRVAFNGSFFINDRDHKQFIKKSIKKLS